jgi:hypothetical protein
MAEAWFRSGTSSKPSSRKEPGTSAATKKRKPEGVEKEAHPHTRKEAPPHPRTMRDWFLKIEPKENSIPEAEASSGSSPPPPAAKRERKNKPEANDDADGSTRPAKKKLKPIDQDNFYGHIPLPKKTSAFSSKPAETKAVAGSGWGAQRKQMEGASVNAAAGRAATNSLLCDDENDAMDDEMMHAGGCREEVKRDSGAGGDARSVWKSLHNQARLSQSGTVHVLCMKYCICLLLINSAA